MIFFEKYIKIAMVIKWII